MNLHEWIERSRPGSVEEFVDRIEIAHECGEHSTLWKSTTDGRSHVGGQLGNTYLDYDGIDLFSSTFKFASTVDPKLRAGVKMTFTLKQLQNEVGDVGCNFPESSIPFLYQSGIGFYAVDVVSGRLYECDADSGELSDEYESLEALLDDWIIAVT
ncbi:hypothetical protein [Roseiconus lacunae]|uniref:SMI1/KNR4 family protein n=1 Tax=Roseiconus lacunae TaxID=2605694 RepID=A0ABT7PI67_9BACT|nr:hypothetical protein [Roseiconus lacunae]MDM4015941.1 hypothetical protein [Roseiconus lacunae]